MVIQQSLSEAIKAQLAIPVAVNVSVSDAVSVPLVGCVVGSSSRGPVVADQLDQARGRRARRVRLGDRRFRHGHRSVRWHLRCDPDGRRRGRPHQGQVPDPDRPGDQVPADEHGRDDDHNNAANTPGYLAPITRIGGGEVRVNRAVNSPAAAWADGNWTGAISFGFVDAWRAKTVHLARRHRPQLQRLGDHLRDQADVPLLGRPAPRRHHVHGTVHDHHPGAKLSKLHAQDDDQRRQAP